MTLYSYNGAAPAPLPSRSRIRVPDGAGGWRSRTDPGTFTAEELAAAGYVTAEAGPEPTARQLGAVWVDGAWSLPDKPIATRKAEMIAAARKRYGVVADGGTSVELAPGVAIAVATRVEPALKLMRAAARMTAQSLASMEVVTTAGAPVDLTPAAAAAMLGAIDKHVAGCEATQNALVTAILGAVDHDALDLVDIEVGTVDGVGGWPAAPA